MEALRLISAGLSNRDVGERLFLALDTVRGHNRKIFGKLQVQRRTEAVARARELGLAWPHTPRVVDSAGHTISSVEDPLLQTKLYIPRSRTALVARPR